MKSFIEPSLHVQSPAVLYRSESETSRAGGAAAFVRGAEGNGLS